ncbi:MAG: AAA family ATPase, partial [Alphaproteobacteria bacterium]|nr:AAA family ATPase [Alphaproteobacteria bacterium]
GGLLRWITSSSEVTGASLDQVWGTNLKYITVAFLFFGGLIMFLYNWIQKNVLTDPRLYDPETMGTSKKKKKVKLSFTEGLKVVFSSKYLCFIAMLVLGYGISINLVEITWKSQLKLQYPDTNSYVNFMGFFSQMTGFTTIILMIVGNNILRRLGWFTGAIITPVMVLITGASFFTFVIFRDDMTPLMAALTVTPVLLAVIVGAAQNILSKSTKYSLFDPTKEMSYIPLDDNLKVRGKAAVDGVGGRLGKSGGAIMQQILLVSIVGSTQITIAPILAVIVMAIVGVWLFAVFGLSKQYYALRAKQETKKSKTSAA